MADAVGLDGIHSVTGVCDLCGGLCDPNAQELNALDCTFPNCPSESNVYHQDCLEKYLKSIKLEKNRKTGFKCPRGCGKGTAYSEQCPGRIDKSHPIVSRNETNKKRRKAKGADTVTRQVVKEKSLNAKLQAKVAPAPDVSLPRDAEPNAEAKPSKTHEEITREQILALAQAARLQLGHASAIKRQPQTLAVQKELKTLEEYERAKEQNRKSLRPAVPTVSAWTKPPPIIGLRSAPESWDGGAAAPAALQPLSAAVSMPALARSLSVQVQSTQGSWAAAASAGLLATLQDNGQAKLSSAHQPAVSQMIRAESAPTSIHMPPAHGASTLRERPLSQPAYELHNDTGKLTKAQKKNMKRKQKKGAQQFGNEGSDEGSDASAITSHFQDGGSHSEESYAAGKDGWSHCAAILRNAKLQVQIQQLTQLGFLEWQAHAAISRYGSNVDASACWLLETPNLQPEDSPTPASIQATVQVDSEMSRLRAISSSLGCSVNAVVSAVLECQGQIDPAIDLLSERFQQFQTDQHRHGGGQRKPRLSQEDALSSHTKRGGDSVISSDQQLQAPIAPPFQQNLTQQGTFGIDVISSYGFRSSSSQLVQRQQLLSDPPPQNTSSNRGSLGYSPSGNSDSTVAGSVASNGGLGLIVSRGLRSEADTLSFWQPATKSWSPSGSTLGDASWRPDLGTATPHGPLAAMGLLLRNGYSEVPNPFDLDCENSEISANQALGSELLGLVGQEDGACELPLNHLPAFFSDGHMLCTGALEDGDIVTPGSEFRPSHAKGIGEPWSSVSDTYSLWPESLPNSGWGTDGKAYPKEALFGALGVFAEDAVPLIHQSPENLPEERELDALMATLVCR